MNVARPGFRTLAVVGAAVAGTAVFAAAGGARTAATAPTSSSLPTVSGSAQQGKTLTAASGTWAGTTPMKFAYAWQRCDTSGASCVAIADATAQTYTIVLDDVGYKLRVAVTATNSAGSMTADSAVTSAVTGSVPPSSTALPQITGKLVVGSTLSSSNGTWSGTTPITYTFQWQRCDQTGAACAAVSGATKQTYTLAAADNAHTLRVAVTAANAGGSAQATSAATGVVSISVPVVSGSATLSGTAVQGQSLTVSSNWTGATPISYAYQWWRCDATGNNCVAIAGSTGQAYQLTANDVGHVVFASVTATNSVGVGHANTNRLGPVTAAATTTTTTTTTTTPAPSGTVKLPNGETSVSVANVPDTDRLNVSRVAYAPRKIVGRAPVTMTVKITDANKYDVAGALVYVVGLPYGWAKISPESATAADGTVSLTITPTAKMPKTGSLVLFVRARTPQGSALAGSSTRRLVQVLIRP